MDVVLAVHATGGDFQPLRLPGTRVGLMAPGCINGEGITLSRITVDGSSVERVVGFSMEARLDRDRYRYAVEAIRITAMPVPLVEWTEMGAEAVAHVDGPVLLGIRYSSVYRAVLDDLASTGRLPVLLGSEETTIVDGEMTADETAVAGWMTARLAFSDPNVLISKALGCSREAAGQRLTRLRKAGLLPAVKPGQRQGRT
jgi:hypothetical protein